MFVTPETFHVLRNDELLVAYFRSHRLKQIDGLHLLRFNARISYKLTNFHHHPQLITKM